MSAEIAVGEGKVVTFAYSASLQDGAQTEIPGQPSPVRFAWGSKKVPAGLQSSLQGMMVQEERTVTLPAAEAFGERLPARKVKVKRSKFGAEEDLFPGRRFALKDGDGTKSSYYVTGVTPDYVMLENNHPLAGEELTITVTILRVKDGMPKAL